MDAVKIFLAVIAVWFVFGVAGTAAIAWRIVVKQRRFERSRERRQKEWFDL